MTTGALGQSRLFWDCKWTEVEIFTAYFTWYQSGNFWNVSLNCDSFKGAWSHPVPSQHDWPLILERRTEDFPDICCTCNYDTCAAPSPHMHFISTSRRIKSVFSFCSCAAVRFVRLEYREDLIGEDYTANVPTDKKQQHSCLQLVNYFGVAVVDFNLLVFGWLNGGREGERERERERGERETESERERQRERARERQRDRESERETERQRQRESERESLQYFANVQFKCTYNSRDVHICIN